MALGVNDNGDFVGVTGDMDLSPRRGFAYQGGSVLVVERPAGFREAAFTYINDRGLIVGVATGPPMGPRAATWTESGGWRFLVDPVKWPESGATDVNSLGHIALQLWNSTSSDQIIALWTERHRERLINDLLGAQALGWVFYEIVRVTDKGVLVGNGLRPGDGKARPWIATPKATRVGAGLVVEAGATIAGAGGLSVRPERGAGAAVVASARLDSAPHYLWLTGEVRASGPAQAVLEVRDLTTGHWDTVDVARTPVGREWTKVELVLTGDLARYRAPDGTVSVRATVRPTLPTARARAQVEFRAFAFEAVLD